MPVVSRFLRMHRWARRRGAFLSSGFHAGLLWLLVAGGAAAPGRIGPPPMPDLPGREGAVAPALTLVEAPEPTAVPGAPSGVDPETMRARLRLGARERAAEDPAALLSDLGALLGQAEGISAESLGEIGLFLGAKPGEYKPRTAYADELNPNCSLVRAIVTEAEREAAGPSWKITVADGERDAWTFALSPAAAQMLEAGEVRFAGRSLAPGAGGAVFELQSARIAALDLPQEGEEAILTLESAAGVQRTLRLPAPPGSPWRKAGLRFRRTAEGRYLLDPDDETTPFIEGIDMDSLSIWRMDRAPAVTPGQTRARVEMIDRKGERMIYFVEGPEAEALLERGGILSNPAVRRIYEGAGAAGLLRGMLDEAPASSKPKRAPQPAPKTATPGKPTVEAGGPPAPVPEEKPLPPADESPE